MEKLVDLPFLNSIVLLLIGTIVTFLVTRYWTNRRLIGIERDRAATANVARDSRIVELEKQLAMMSAAVVPISTAFQAILIKELTHFHTPELDALLVKLGPPITLTYQEESRMAALLKERANIVHDAIDDSERDAARMLPMVMRRVRAETESPEKPESIQIVGIPPEAKAEEEPR